MIPAGERDTRLTLQRAATTANSVNEQIETWFDVVTVWAALKPLSGREAVNANQIYGLVSHKITIPYRRAVTPTMRFIAGSRIFNIVSVIEDEDLIIMATEVV